MLYTTGKGMIFTRILPDQYLRRKSVKDPGLYFPVILCLAIITVTILFFLWSRLETVKIGYEISKEKRQTIELVDENKNLRLKVVSLRSPKRIERLAKKKFGLIYPLEKQIVVIR